MIFTRSTVPRRAFLAAAIVPSACRVDRLSSGRPLARKLAALYAEGGSARERWGGRAPSVEVAGVSVPRRLAYRDDPLFPAACAVLLEASSVNEARLGAWLLEGVAPAFRDDAVRVAHDRLKHRDAVVRFQLLRSLLELGDAPSVARATAGSSIAHEIGLHHLSAPNNVSTIPSSFTPGACFWYEGHENDFGASQFEKLARFGVRAASLHTFDPLQQGKHNPVLREPRRRFSIPDLARWVEAAKRWGIEVTFKPHLEMGFRRLSEQERGILSAGTEREKVELRSRIERERADAGWHGDIEMQSESDWRRWFAGYSSYLLDHARSAALAGASVFCVGRELDRTVMARASEWRILIRSVREVFQGRLTYSAHHDSFDRLPFWDALDVIGVSAYPPVSRAIPPPMTEVETGWSAFVARCAALSTRVQRPLIWSEVGYPAADTAAREPWREDAGDANVILQSDLLGSALGAARRSGAVGGAWVWLWEGVSEPPFRDRSFTVQNKPASYAMAAAYRGGGGIG